ncbi:hypothetical protein JOY44_20535 [Phormidium sp. CLA17]|uniref:hypothetical protein n=1 Tax=Leptolyngbya sp. Cla-17 TaxID=2803751 RepID=UPI001493122A|nr:hypothetical protein [Leptolyngbya sp. Cla-17]MBM0743978.1 hypothetical protein [Leptolyngbya sp. Cla-17]
MVTLFSQAIARIRSLFKGLQLQQFFAFTLVGFILLTTNANAVPHNDALGAKVRERIEQTDKADRPKTTGEWNREAKETEGNPGKRIGRIAKESGEAFKQFGSGYVKGAQETAGDIQSGAAQIGRD